MQTLAGERRAPLRRDRSRQGADRPREAQRSAAPTPSRWSRRMSEATATTAVRRSRPRAGGCAPPRSHPIGIALPDRVVTNAPIAARIGVADGWIESRTGVHSRRYATAGETLVGLATARRRRRARPRRPRPARARPRHRRQLHRRTTCCRTPRRSSPRELGATRAGAFDVGSACTGFLSALERRHRADRDRRRRQRARHRRRSRIALPQHGRPPHRRAVRRRRRRRGRQRHRPAPARSAQRCSAPTGAARSTYASSAPTRSSR